MPDLDALVRSFWSAFDRGDFDAAAALMAPAAVVTWPCTGEMFRGRDRFIEVQRRYPGRWRIAVERVVPAPGCVVTAVKVTAEGSGGPSFHTTSFFELDVDGRIMAIAEYWATDEEPPEWRKSGGWTDPG